MKYIFKNIVSVLKKKEQQQFGILILLDIFISLLDIFSLAVLLWIIQLYVQPGHKSSLSFLPASIAKANSVLFIALFVIFFAIKNWSAYLVSKAYNTFSSKVAIRISQQNLINYQQAAFEEFINKDSSAHIRTICFQPFEYCQYMLAGIQQLITQCSLILITIIAIVLFNAKLFLLLLLILLPPVIVVAYFIKRKLTAAKKNIQESNQQSLQYLLDALKGYVEGNIYNRNEFFLKRFVTTRQQFSTHLFDSIALQGMPNRIIEIFAVLGLFVMVVIAKWTGNDDSATFITIGAFMAAAYKIIPGIVKMINVSGQMKAYDFTLNELTPRKKGNDAAGVVDKAQTLQKIEFKNISFQYAQQRVLNNISFSIEKGDFVGITGESGKGKTTILNLILGFLPAVNGGEILINDVIAAPATIQQCWPSVAYVRQQKFFIHDTLLRNITLEEANYDKEQLTSALNISGLEKLAAGFPEGLEKIITENGSNISGGQQQRVAIARALYKNSEVILLDEPFNEIDEAGTNLLLEHFRQLAQAGKLVVMITHDKKSFSYCNKTISLDA
ncbi:ATP-binding cassette domain-containing protein [Ferruginibacter sp. SUN106]|uniref:ATP-binding cassette domain-containing protein n=1 Tax=Ferruginibacter sp. SUN106 TaxID=2978348 RepID=UPI003D35C4F3